MGGDPGVRDEAEGCVWFWLHGHQKPGQHLLPWHGDAGSLQHPRLPEDVSTQWQDFIHGLLYNVHVFWSIKDLVSEWNQNIFTKGEYTLISQAVFLCRSVQ